MIFELLNAHREASMFIENHIKNNANGTFQQ
jgi:hypothetical protein